MTQLLQLGQHRPLSVFKANPRITIAVVAAASPFVYYGLKFWLWLRKMKPKWDKLTNQIGGPEKHWLYGNLHQVINCFILLYQ